MMSQMYKDCAVLILAAGKGTRMHSCKPKVLHSLLGEPLLAYVIKAAEPFFADSTWVVVDYKDSIVHRFCCSLPVHCIFQEQPLGTGHAVLTALPILQKAGFKRVLVINGDMPLITSHILQYIMDMGTETDIAFATLTVTSPEAYGRVIRKGGEVSAIIEAKDFDIERYGEVKEINTGSYYFSLASALELLPMITSKNNSQEYYLTDMIGLAVTSGYRVKGIDCGDDWHLLGVNTPLELVQAESIQHKAIIEQLLQSGVILHSPENIRVSPFSFIELGVELYGPCEIYGQSYIASGSVVHSHCYIKDSTISHDVSVHSFCHLDTATVGKGCVVGPYARLRPGAIMDEDACIGNFVEMKKARLGKGAKANHLSYLGDADIGSESNIGAGTITCNYDGIHKHETIIGKKAFIGSNTALVAPVTIGDNTLIGAGSVITKDIPNNKLSIARGIQKILPKRK